MAAVCDVCGKGPIFGKSVSHSHVRTNRRWNPNIQRKCYWVPSLGRRITLTLTPKAMKEIDRRGIDVVVAEMLTRGEKI
ncbi:MAG: 50S ribosomal protein L28 [Cutibacterium granulosum]|nr:MAG: 50S ribosomal protein L28 [Cutibacterium granulosum]